MVAEHQGNATQAGALGTPDEGPDYAAFREAIREALNHLHDPDYVPPPLLVDVMGAEPRCGTVGVQQAILEAIDRLRPPEDTPESAPVRRAHDLLRYRFVQRLTQQQTADRLHLTVRSIRREQRVATHMLGRFLWEHRLSRQSMPAGRAGAGGSVRTPPTVSSRTWRAQARRELAALRAESPAAVSDVASVVQRVVELERALVHGHGGTLVSGPLAPGLHAAVHPTALRQVLIMAIGQLCRLCACAALTISTRGAAGAAVITLEAPGGNVDLPEQDLLTDMVELLGGRTTVQQGPERFSLALSLPAVGTVTVAVVDDNADFVHFCRRCVRGTRYRIVEPESGSLEAIKAMAPDVVLLDIILPGVDGWELLDALNGDAETAQIPVIICSIVHEEELASLMGAVEYLPKPVRYQDLLATLDRVSH